MKKKSKKTVTSKPMQKASKLIQLGDFIDEETIKELKRFTDNKALLDEAKQLMIAAKWRLKDLEESNRAMRTRLNVFDDVMRLVGRGDSHNLQASGQMTGLSGLQNDIENFLQKEQQHATSR